MVHETRQTKEVKEFNYVPGDVYYYKRFFKKINEIGYLLNRMMKGVRTARDLHENEKRLKRNSRRSLTSSSE
jgi:hypothetical protein